MLFRLLKPIVQRNHRLAASYRAARDSWKSMSAPATSHFGFQFSGNDAMAAGKFEPVETELILQLLTRVDIFINVGANIGYYCCIAAHLNKPTIAFEPVASNLVYLLKNVFENGYQDRIEVIPIACGNSSDIIPIYGSGTGASLVKGWAGVDPAHRQLISSGRLDRYCPNLDGQLSLILVDVEGAEKYVLEGATMLLENTPKPIWFVEISSNENQPKGVAINPSMRDTFAIFFASGYEAYTATSTPRRIELSEIEAIVQNQKSSLETHNFIFIEPKRTAEFRQLFVSQN